MTVKKHHWYWTVLVFLSISTVSLAQNPHDVRQLEPGKPIERELAGGDFHVYAVQLSPGQLLSGVVDQRGIDLVVTLYGPDSKEVRKLDSPNGANGPEAIAFVAKTAGMHQIEIRSLEAKAPAGRYEVKIHALREATPDERKADNLQIFAATLAAVNTENEGIALLASQPEMVTAELWQELNRLGGGQNGERAMITFRIALRIAEQSGHKVGSVTSLHNIGVTYRRRGDFKSAVEAYQKSSSLAQEIGEKRILANTMLDMGQISEMQNNYPASLEYRQKALSLGEELGNKGLVAAALSQIGWVNFLRGNHRQALEYYEKSLPLREALGNKVDIAQTLNQMSLAYRLQGDFVKAMDHAQRALTLSEPSGNNGLTADILISIGLVYGAEGNLSKALESFNRSLTFAEASGQKGVIANALEKIANVNHSRGNLAPAIDYYQRALKLNEESGNKRQIVFTSNAVAWVYRSQGNYAQAMAQYRKSLKLSEEIGNKFTIAGSMTGIGIISFDQGDTSLALEYFQKSLQLMESVGNSGGVRTALNNIGEVYRAQVDYKRALEFYHRSLSLSEKVGDKGGITETLNNIGETHLAQANYSEALEYFQKSLTISEERGDKLFMPGPLSGMGSVYAAQGNYQKALELFERAALLAAITGNRNQLWNAHSAAGRAYWRLNRPADARRALEEAISIVDSIRTNIAGREARATYFATAQKPYELYVEVLMQMHKQNSSEGNDAVALQMNERSRARSLLEALKEAHADIREGVDTSLLKRERTLQEQLSARAEQQMRLLSGKHSDEQANEFQREIKRLTSEYQEVEAQIRLASPRYAALTQPTPLTLREIQNEILDAETALLEYALGEEHSYLWVVTRNSIKSFELPNRAELETRVRRVVELLNDGKRWSTDSQINSEYQDEATILSRILIPSALLAQLKQKRLLVVGDGALQYLPFGALPNLKSQGSRSQSTNPRPLVADYEIVTLPSASTLAVLRRENVNRRLTSKSVAVIADPVFEETDERVTTSRSVGATEPQNKGDETVGTSRALLQRAVEFETKTEGGAAVRESLQIRRLPFTRFEAENILVNVPLQQSLKATDFRANRETATSAELSKYRFVHFATHAILNSEHPELSGIVLSLVNEQGKPVDGFLRLHDIYNLNLPADLVVLSACQTGLGREIRGEGLVGLTRGFMYAGAPRVVASLWKVDDAATAELMKRFYAAMLKDNLRPAAALRRAKVEMWKQKRWQAPYYWAAFELQGEWR